MQLGHHTQQPTAPIRNKGEGKQAHLGLQQVDVHQQQLVVQALHLSQQLACRAVQGSTGPQYGQSYGVM